jgi:hypothetical protein
VRRKRVARQVDLDVADALFNIACYYSLQLESEAADPTRESLVKKSLKALKESVAIYAENIDDAKEDKDLKAVRESTVGKKVIESSDFTGI